MSYRIHITRTAERDLAQAVSYVESVLKNPTAADRLLDETEAAFQGLGAFPHQFAPIDDPVLSAWGIRFTKIGNYLAFYLLSEETETIEILRFLYGKSDWAAILKQDFTTQ
jgi:plasmid stabilization system protein ParE